MRLRETKNSRLIKQRRSQDQVFLRKNVGFFILFLQELEYKTPIDFSNINYIPDLFREASYKCIKRDEETGNSLRLCFLLSDILGSRVLQSEFKAIQDIEISSLTGLLEFFAWFLEARLCKGDLYQGSSSIKLDFSEELLKMSNLMNKQTERRKEVSF